MITLKYILTLGLLLMAGTASTITCLGDYTETYTDTITRAVGPTTQVGARGTLPQPSPTDLNTIFIAPNGNDSTGTGTQANPYLTIAKALTALGGAFTTVQIIRNGYVGDLVFTINGTRAFGANNLQAASGEIGIVQSDSLTTKRTVSVSTGKINGILGRAVTFACSSTGSFDNVGADVQYVGGFIFTNGANTSTANYSYGSFEYAPSAVNSTLTLTNCILLQSRRDNNVIVLTLANNGAGSYAVNFTRCLINQKSSLSSTASQAPIAVNDGADSGARTTTLAFTSSFIYATLPYFISHIAGAANKTITVTEDYCYHAASIAEQTVSGEAVTYTLTPTNELDLDAPLLVNQSALSDQPVDVTNAQLQIRGKTTADGSGTYFISSPLKGAGSAGVDVNPWDETVTGPIRSYGSEFTFEMAPASHSIEPEFVGAKEVDELNGGSSQDFDSLRRTWKINWPDSNRDALNNDWKRIQALLWDKGRKKVYLRGTSGNFLDGFASQAVFDNTDTLDGAVDGSFALVNPASPGTIAWNWRNWWLEVTVGSITYEYWVYTSDGDSAAGGTKLYIVDKLGSGLPSNGTYDVAVRYFLASLRLEGQPLSFSGHIPGFLDGQRYAEGYDTGSIAPTTDPERFQGKGFTLLLVEQTDPKPGPANPA